MFDEQDFAIAKSLGADVIRLPVRLHSMTLGALDFTIDPLFFMFLDSAVSWAEVHGLYLIIDNHSFDPANATSPAVEDILLKVWSQVASRYSYRGPLLSYEILNGPHGIADDTWCEIQSRAIEAIRNVDRHHMIVVRGSEWNSITALLALPTYDDDNLIYTFHFYDPFIFTHQGATWCGPGVPDLAKIPFPAGSGSMPALPPAAANTWVAEAFSTYARSASRDAFAASFDKVVRFSRDRRVRVFCGEFGVYARNSQDADRVRWYAQVTDLMVARGISRTSWDYFGWFGVFARDDMTTFNSGVLRATGFTPCRPRPRASLSGFCFFADFVHNSCTAGCWDRDATLDFHDDSAVVGRFTIKWGNAVKYGSLAFKFKYLFDMEEFVADWALHFLAKTDQRIVVDVRFLNADPIPWRMTFVLTQRVVPPDGKWHLVRVPLSMMVDSGAWVTTESKWMRPQGRFDWKAVTRLEFVATAEDMRGKLLFLDSIMLSKIVSC
jgi:endoglucanase